MIKLEIYDACSSETLDELYYSSIESMKADFQRIESEYKERFSNVTEARIELKGNNGELKLFSRQHDAQEQGQPQLIDVLDNKGQEQREPLYLTVKTIKVR